MLDPNVVDRVRNALFAQKYNLLVGAGVSLDSLDRHNKPLLSAEDLRQNLCKLTGSRDTSPLWRVAGLLTPQQIEDHLTRPYLGCRAGPTVRALTRFAWKTAFTLNIDDALENAYETNTGRLQTIVPVNYTREYETFRNPQELPLIHLHGFVRNPDDRYVFSLQEYATLQRGLNPWVHTLSGLIVSEPFVIAGTALFEPDLEYFFSHRASKADILARAPSILVEPSPDAGTRRDCERLGLVLVQAKLEEFLSWLIVQFGIPPTPLALREPLRRPQVVAQSPVHTSVAFWSDFDFVSPPSADPAKLGGIPSAFLFGRQPTWEDIDKKLDVPLHGQLQLIDEVRRWQASDDDNQVVCLSGRAGSGKTTTIRRVASELATRDLQVFYVKARGGIDIDSATSFISSVVDPLVIATDSFAEHGDQLVDLMKEIGKKKRVCILAAERQYRMGLVRDLLEDTPHKLISTEQWRVDERTELVRRYTTYGLVGNADAVSNPRSFANQLADDTVAEAVCRILNDFRPLRVIVRSLWNDTIQSGRAAYLVTALAYYCHPVGIRRDVVLSMCPEDLLSDLAAHEAPLRVVPLADDDAYLVPGNPTLAALLVEEMSRLKPMRLLEIAVQLANSLAPFVTRHTIKQRTTEARLAGRLFDADGVLPELLKEKFDDFYDLTLDQWKWNSRYWEQRALHISERDRPLAIQHARHAVAIERHPFPMTTLAKVLFSAATDENPVRHDYFKEALALMEETLRIEAQWERGRTRKAYWTLFDGTLEYLQAGGRLTVHQVQVINRAIGDSQKSFSSGTEKIHQCATQLSSLINT